MLWESRGGWDEERVSYPLAGRIGHSKIREIPRACGVCARMCVSVGLPQHPQVGLCFVCNTFVGTVLHFVFLCFVFPRV